MPIVWLNETVELPRLELTVVCLYAKVCAGSDGRVSVLAGRKPLVHRVTGELSGYCMRLTKKKGFVCSIRFVICRQAVSCDIV